MILNYKIQVEIIPAKQVIAQTYDMSVYVAPASVARQTLRLDYPFEFNLSQIPINISEPIKNSAFQFLTEILENYVDEDRELKTLLNLGEDRQSVIVSYRYGVPDEVGNNTLQVKLLEPLSDEILSNEEGVPTEVFISREIANSVIQSVRFLDAPLIDRTPFLRPKNTGISVNEDLGRTLKNVTLNVLNLETGSLGGTDSSKNISFEDAIFRRWYSYDFKSSELNIDFTDYNNFVFYGSATMRLYAFRQKLLEIEKLTQSALQFEGSVFTGSLASAGATYILEQSTNLSLQKENIIRSFDRYEQHLYFTSVGTESSYSASAWYADGGSEYNELSYWPKMTNGNLYPVESEEADAWFNTQIEIANRFDEFNENNLINTIPTHIREDEENASYFTFVTMIGHFFDTIKPYADQFPYIYSRNIDPDEELSKDLVTEIAESIGFKLPTIDSIYTLSESVLSSSTAMSKRQFTVEAYKRLLHNIPFFAKSKGTRTALRMVLSSLGITEQLITVQESGVSDENSFRVLSEFYNSVNFTGTPAHIQLPVSSSLRTPYPRTLQLNLAIAENKNMTVLSGDDTWKLDVKVNPSNNNLIKIELLSANNTIFASTKYFKNKGSDIINVSIQTSDVSASTTLRIINVNQEDVIIDQVETDQGGFISLWDNTDNIYLGGSGSILTDSFIGAISDVRLWGINLADHSILNAAFDPMSNAGNTFTDPSDFLYIQISLNKFNPLLLIESSSILNESPYENISDSPSLQFINVVGLTTESISRDTRYVRQQLPVIGSAGYVTNKVKVAPPPIFIQSQDLNGPKRLYRNRSIVKLENKTKPGNLNNVNISSSPAQLINQNIIRNIGLSSISETYGIPNNSYKTLPNTLENLRNHYNKFYYVTVNTNNFLRIIESISSIARQITDYFIPSRATLYSGIVIEPTLLERTKIPLVKNIKFYGKGSRRTNNVLESSSFFRKDYEATFTLSDEVNVSNEIVIGSYLTKDAIVDANQQLTLIVSSSAFDANAADTISTISSLTAKFSNIYENLTGKISNIDIKLTEIEQSISGSFHLIDTQHPSWDIAKVLKSFNNPQDPDYESSKELIIAFPGKYKEKKVFINMGYDELNKVGFSLGTGPRYGLVGVGREGAEPYGRIYSRKLFEYEISRPRSGGVTSLIRSSLYAIKPSCDLEDFGARTYFGQPFGIYYFPKKIKIPFYSNEINATWDILLQEFSNAVTWSYGDRYQPNDVVYQDVQLDSSYSEILGEEFIKAARRGNERYYVFKTSPSYENSVERLDGQAVYLSNIPSTLPPSLDRNNWARLRFSPKIIREPRRVVFDTFIVQDPKLNDFKTTTVSIERRIDLPERFIDLFSIGNIPVNSRKLGEISVQNIAMLLGIQLSNISLPIQSPNIRIRLYRSLAARDNDASRPLYQYPSLDAGVLLDMNITEYGVANIINPIVTLISGDASFDGTLYYTIDNLTSSPSGFLNLYLYYFAAQIEPRLPLGYLRKHYRYFRDTATATKRRNFEGCKNTESTTIDGLPPIQIFLSEDTDVTVSPVLENNEIQFGGGGTFSQ